MEHFLNSLTNPSEIWRSAFENQISELSKYLLYSVLISHGPIKEGKLIHSVKEMINYDSQRFNLSLRRGGFLNSLKELENTFIKIKKGLDTENYIEFQNPSVNDFLIHYIENDNDLIKMIINSMVFFNQLFTIFNPYNKTENSFSNYPRSMNLTHKIELKDKLKKTLERKIIRDFDKMKIREGIYEYQITDKIMYLNQFYDYKSEDLNHFLARKIEDVNINLLEADEPEEFVMIIHKLKRYLRLNVNDLMLNYIEHIDSLSGVRGLIELSNIYPEEYQLYIEYNKDILMEIIEGAIYADADNVDNNEDDIISFKSEVEDVCDFFNEKFKSTFDLLDEKLKDVKHEYYEDDFRLPIKKEESLSKKDEDLKIDSMFISLLG
ncbi:hypothetical protein [Paenibacillus sp. IHB B 3084]|uniref:hypothetical protein n=1 Tax=Paenibacillus sp. IHB B 3084 TaxID=867076 RepID=UPI000A43B534|nr:hypothetical protein [Paenibacillus sp. IHB B 3084]